MKNDMAGVRVGSVSDAERNRERARGCVFLCVKRRESSGTQALIAEWVPK